MKPGWEVTLFWRENNSTHMCAHTLRAVPLNYNMSIYSFRSYGTQHNLNEIPSCETLGVIGHVSFVQVVFKNVLRIKCHFEP